MFDPRYPALLSACCILLAATPASASGWTQDKGNGYLKGWGMVVPGSRAFMADGSVVDVESYANFSANFYGEYGASDDLTLTAYGRPVGSASYGDASTTYSGPFNLGLRHRVLRGDHNVAVEVRLGVEPGSEDLVPEDDPYDVDFIPTQFGSSLEGLVGYGTALSFGWVALAGGVRWSSRKNLDPAAVGQAQLGMSFSKRVSGEVHVPFRVPFGEIEETEVSGSGQTRYVGLGLSASYWFTPHLAVSGGLDGALVAYANAAAPTLNLGLESKF